MKSILATIAVVGTVAIAALYGSQSQGTFLHEARTSEVELAFHHFLAQEGKNYGTKEEYNKRYAIFSNNYHQVMHHNMFLSKDTGIVLGMNSYSDMSMDEFNSKMLGYKGTKAASKPHTLNVSSVPDSMDWRQHGAVTPVKNQGQCGSCWSFSTTGSMEGAHFLATKNLVSLSEQQFVDCSKNGNMGCNGGLMDTAFKYAETTGIETESEYPYTARDGSCHAKGGKVKVTSFKDVPQRSEVQLRSAIAKQPVSVAVCAASFGWQLYSGGIMKNCCSQLDHGVLAVGYGSDNGKDYYLVKNSWGAGWGEKGYIRLARTKGDTGAGTCNIQMSASYPETN